MKVLSVECSAGPASVAIIDEDRVLYSSYTNIKTTHSETLIPMIFDALKVSKLNADDIEYFAVAAGPGSFTGIRIGISAIKGLAAKNNTPCVLISTLFAMAVMHKDFEGIICAVMDARCNQVYNALFRIKNNTIARLTDDRALLCEDLKTELLNHYSSEKILIVGDGSDIFYPFIKDFPNVSKSDESNKYQNAIGVAFAATKDIKNGNTLSPAQILPVYLRLPQAERELKKKQKKEEN